MRITEKRHRLPEEYYRGEVSVAFTLCLKGNVAAGFSLREPEIAGFSLREPEIVKTFIDILTSVVTKAYCIVPVYCFMPDHQHLIITGTTDNSDICNVIVSYKQKTGFWLSMNKPEIKWQKDFYDHVIKRKEDIATQVRYILDNPVRKGLVSSWNEYPFKGSVGCKIEDVLKWYYLNLAG